MNSVSRRSFLATSAATLALLRMTEAAAAPARAGSLESGSFDSQFKTEAPVGWCVYRPANATGRLRPLIGLPPRNAAYDWAFTNLGISGALDDAIARGTAPFALVGVDHHHGFYSAQEDGEDGGRMVVEELLPLLRSKGLDVSTVGLIGWSSGGYGAVRIAEMLGGAPRVGALVGSAPTVWAYNMPNSLTHFGDGPGQEDFNVLLEGRSKLNGIPVKVDSGDSDEAWQAKSVNNDFFGALNPPVTVSYSPGGHDDDFWSGVLPGQLDFVGKHIGKR